MAESFLKIGLVQSKSMGSVEANLALAESSIEVAAERGARVVCLQELFASAYFCQEEDEAWFELAEPIPGPTTQAMQRCARKLGIVLIVPVFEKRAPGVYHNSAVVIDADGTILGTYRKMHIPDDPGFYEKYYFAPGDLGFKTWTTSAGKIGVLICWDQWFPEAARLTAMQGAGILFYPTAIGWLPSEKESLGQAQVASWETSMRGHAIANGCFVAAVNRTGHEAPAGGEGIEFWGQSFVANPQGEVIASAGTVEEEVLVVDIDLQQVEAQRKAWPFFRDRRIDAYEELTKRWTDS
ncbi:MAG: carbon-nitrogen hydrolase [Verrucomicrobiota bacterium]